MVTDKYGNKMCLGRNESGLKDFGVVWPFMNMLLLDVYSGVATLGHWPYHQPLWPHHQDLSLLRDLTHTYSVTYLWYVA